jgi:prephenate dehydrogenase
VREGGLLMDLTSLKVRPVEAMLAHARCEVIGAHPLFGPGAPSLSGHTVVLCPARGERWLPWVKGLFESEGGRVVLAEPAHHDRLMACVQALTHFDTLAFALTLARLKVPLEELLHFATPNFNIKLKQAARLLRQDGALYAEIEAANPHTPRTLGVLAESSTALIKAIASAPRGGSAEAFKALFDEAAAFFATLPEADYRELTSQFVLACQQEESDGS